MHADRRTLELYDHNDLDVPEWRMKAITNADLQC